MTRKIVLALGCLVLLATSASIAMADIITFSFSVTSGTVTTIADEFGSPSLTGGPVGGAVIVKDTNTALTLTLPTGSTGMIQSDNNFLYSSGATMLSATYAGSGAIQTEVISSYCPGSICLSGTNNFGTYTALKGSGGGFGGSYHLTYVSPAIVAFFGDTGNFVFGGGDAYTTSFNHWVTGGTTSGAEFGSGSITFETRVIPEPGTLALMGTGIIGLAGLIRRKKA